MEGAVAASITIVAVSVPTLTVAVMAIGGVVRRALVRNTNRLVLHGWALNRDKDDEGGAGGFYRCGLRNLVR